MTNPPDTDLTAVYRIKFRGWLKESWSDWFDGMTIEYCIEAGEKPVTTLTGCIPDQSALYGVLNKIRDLGLRLLSVERIVLDQENDDL